MNPGRTGLRLRGRLMLGLVALAAVLSAGLAAAAELLVRRALEQELGAGLQARLAGVERTLGARGQAVERALADLAAQLGGAARGLLERPEAAARLLRGSGLDLLELEDGAGRVLVSAHWPERAGLVRSLGAELPAAGAVLVAAEGRDWQGPALLAGRELGEGLRLVGGQRLGADFVAEIAQGQAAILFDAAGGPPLPAGRGVEVDPVGAGRLSGAGASDPRLLGGMGASTWWAASRELRGGAGERV
ncbi:MAG TPA: hypothetical protein VJS92_07540, partial [Candidatus Polarisedimenticolaceae bacterium]|nr:hypothetical protein [Candidatus Polarisedimenticolaceae bacterium]